MYRRYGGPDVLELAEVPQPQPREREVLVRVHEALVPKPDGLSFQEAAATPTAGYTALRVIDYRHEDVTRDSQRYDFILAANAYRPFSDYRRLLKPDGSYVMTGGGSVQLLQAMLLGAFVSLTSRRRMGNIMAVARKHDLVVLKELLEAGKIKPVIDRTVALSAVPDAIRYLEEEHARGKVVVSVSPPLGLADVKS